MRLKINGSKKLILAVLAVPSPTPSFMSGPIIEALGIYDDDANFEVTIVQKYSFFKRVRIIASSGNACVDHARYIKLRHVIKPASGLYRGKKETILYERF